MGELCMCQMGAAGERPLYCLLVRSKYATAKRLEQLCR